MMGLLVRRLSLLIAAAAALNATAKKHDKSNPYAASLKAFALKAQAFDAAGDGTEPTASGGWWAHAQSMCKPWLATPKILAGSERCRGINGYFFCTLWPAMADELRRDCPAFEAARRGIAARLSCTPGGPAAPETMRVRG